MGGGVGGGVKSFRSEGFKQWGSTLLMHNCWSNGNTADKRFLVGGLNPGRLTLGGGGGAKTHGTGFRTADPSHAERLLYHSATASSALNGLPTAWGRICH